MPASIQRENNDTYVFQISGTLLKSELADAQDLLAAGIDSGTKPRILAILQDFEGFEPGAAWGELEFLFFHSHEVEKIAIVGERQWERSALAFAGDGHRRAPVRYFPADEQASARAWLLE